MDPPGAAIGYGEIRCAVAVEISSGDQLRRGSDGVGRGGAKRAVAHSGRSLAEQHGNRAGVSVGHEEVTNPVAIEVVAHEPQGRTARVEATPRAERAVARAGATVPEQARARD